MGTWRATAGGTRVTPQQRFRPREWIHRRLAARAWLRGQRDELISQLAEQAGQKAATQFKPVIDSVIRYAKLATWFGLAGFVVGLLALIGFLVVILGLL